MTNFKNFTDLELLDLTKTAAKNEKAATLVLLTHLEEVDKRRAYATDAYSSLFDYVVRGLGYAEGQAAERVSAVRLMREVPEVKTHIEEGNLTQTSAALIHRHLRAEKAVVEKNRAKNRTSYKPGVSHSMLRAVQTKCRKNSIFTLV